MEEVEACVHLDAGLKPWRRIRSDSRVMSNPEVSTEEGRASKWGPTASSRELQDRAWENGERVEGNDAELWRKDEFGAWIHRLEYGNRRSEFGWEWADSPGRPGSAMRPLQWQNYIDQVAAHTQSRVTATGLRNIRRLL